MICLYINVEYVNLLNVFFVFDGDIGINMNLLMISGVKVVVDFCFEKVGELVGVLFKGLLMGVCGNFGVILF